MDETIGVKGGRRDRLRTLIISKNKKEKLKKLNKKRKQEKLKKLEKEVKRITIANFLVAVPISIAGNTFETLLNLRDNKKEEKEEAKSLQKEELHQADKLELEETSTYIEDYQLNDTKFTDYGYPKTIEGKKVVSIPKIEIKKEYPKEVKVELKPKKETKKEEIKVEVKEKKQDVIPIPTINYTNLKKLEDKKIVEKYEDNLKDIKQEIKKVVYEYTLLEKQEEKIKDKEDAQEILIQLNKILRHLDALKDRLKTEIADKDVEEYLESLIDNYMESFKEKKTVEDINDSELYIMLSEKIEEAKTKANNLNTKVEDEKQSLELDQERLEQLKDSFYDFENFNNQLLILQFEQDSLLKELEDKVNNSVSITEKVTYKVEFLNKQSKRMLSLLAIPMLIPGNRSAKAMATATASYILLMKNLLNPKMKKRKYRTINVTDYSKEIENGISQIDNALSLITKSSNKLEDMLYELEKSFDDRVKELSEYKELVSNLQKLLSELKEKEEELTRKKKEQEALLEKNNDKVKVLSKEEM